MTSLCSCARPGGRNRGSKWTSPAGVSVWEEARNWQPPASRSRQNPPGKEEDLVSSEMPGIPALPCRERTQQAAQSQRDRPVGQAWVTGEPRPDLWHSSFHIALQSAYSVPGCITDKANVSSLEELTSYRGVTGSPHKE